MEYKANQSSSKNNLLTNQQTASLINLGCPKNQVLAEKIVYLLQHNGYAYEPFNGSREYGLVIVNTCGFIRTARAETDRLLHKLQLYKQQFPATQIIILGCDVTFRGDSLLSEYPEFTFLRDQDSLKALNTHLRFSGESSENYQTISNDRYAYIQIAEGCNHGCSYCLIPSIKGKYKSIPPETIIHQAENLIQRFSVKEIILIAQDTTSYGEDLSEQCSLIELTKKLSRLTDLHWIRCLYLFPPSQPDFFHELLSVPKVVPYVDLPLQHVSKRILQSMNRPVMPENFIQNLVQLKKEFPLFTIRTTFMVGYPGETESDFQELLNSLRQYQFDRAGFFAFSSEPTTKANKMSENIADEVKESRLAQAYEVQQLISQKSNQQWIHHTLPVLIEQYDPIRKGFIGRTVREAPEIDPSVFVTTTSSHPRQYCGKILPMQVEEAEAYKIKGKLLTA